MRFKFRRPTFPSISASEWQLAATYSVNCVHYLLKFIEGARPSEHEFQGNIHGWHKMIVSGKKVKQRGLIILGCPSCSESSARHYLRDIHEDRSAQYAKVREALGFDARAAYASGEHILSTG
jgi:hypothetical protein